MKSGDFRTLSDNASTKVTIQNKLGLHARPVMMFVEVASAFASRITVRRGTYEVDGKSTLLMMTLGATRGTELEIVAEGSDAQRAISELVNLIESGFEEE